jgi:DNA-binding transcriptional ArsR family regulator
LPVPEQRILAAAALLRQLGNDRRLLVLCHLAAEGEVQAGRLAERVGLTQPALSQHLTRLRADGLVATRRFGTGIHYRLADPRVARLLELLHTMFCPDPEA